MRVLNCIKEGLGYFWCLFMHDFVLNKHVMLKAYAPYECKKCGRK